MADGVEALCAWRVCRLIRTGDAEGDDKSEFYDTRLSALDGVL